MNSRCRNYFCEFKRISIRFFTLTFLLISMNANAGDWVLVSEYVGNKVYVHRPSIARKTIFIHTLEKHVLNPPTPHQINGKLIKELLFWNEYDTVSSLVRLNHMALKYVDGTKDDLDTIEPEWNPAERVSGEILRFLNNEEL